MCVKLQDLCLFFIRWAISVVAQLSGTASKVTIIVIKYVTEGLTEQRAPEQLALKALSLIL